MSLSGSSRREAAREQSAQKVALEGVCECTAKRSLFMLEATAAAPKSRPSMRLQNLISISRLRHVSRG